MKDLLIKNNFWELIKTNKKTIELRKWNECFLENNSVSKQLLRNQIALIDYKTKVKLGSIVIKQYEIVTKSSFIKWVDDINYPILGRKTNLGVQKHTLDNNRSWIWSNKDWLLEYFKNSNIIVILEIGKVFIDAI